MALVYPAVARIDCHDCLKHRYNLETGKRLEYDAEEGIKLPILRGNEKAPCEICPKKEPDLDRRLVLSHRNHQALDFYHRMKATPGVSHPLLKCRVTQRIFYEIETAIEAAKNEVRSNAMKDKD